MNHCVVFDIGKTNKKAFVFDEGYRIVFEKTAHLPETTDDDGDPCEDIELLKTWVCETAQELWNDPRFCIKATNCTAYGASFVHLNASFEPVAPIYNYLKPFPDDLQQWFGAQYGSAEQCALETASPVLGFLNSGLQLLWLKHYKPFIFGQIKYALHLPQWVAFLLSGQERASLVSELTSIGCHTMLWDFQKKDYHDWVKAAHIVEKFPPIVDAGLGTATGLHDSSAALIPYLSSFDAPFVLLSTGTWCISLNPFNAAPLTADELAQDCLCYLTFEGKPVKAARYFGGNIHDAAVNKIATKHSAPSDFYKNTHLSTQYQGALEDYAAFMQVLVQEQVASTKLAIGDSAVHRIFVDGGFSKNEMYMKLLAGHFSEMEIFAADVAQATALGAALAIHSNWNPSPIPAHLIALNRF